MKTLSRIIVKYRSAILVLFLLATVACAALIPNVVVNRDMTVYLPETLQSKSGLEVMKTEFGEETTFRVMTEDVPEGDRAALAEGLSELEGVQSVSYEESDASFNSGDSALFEVSVTGGTYSDEVVAADAQIRGYLADAGATYRIDSPAADADMGYLGPILTGAVLLGVAVLFIMSKSWVDPVLVFLNVLLAVIINMGTNAFFPSVSDVTYSIAAVLQMALSMDYAIMLMSRYRQERLVTDDCEAAMRDALVKGSRAIASSSLTTVVGLLTLVLMSFTIGRDLGLVLAKGVLLSLVCGLCIMPALCIWADGLMRRFAKRAPRPTFSALADFSARRRVPVLTVFVLLVVASFGLKGLTAASYHVESRSTDPAAIDAVFPAEESVVVLYPSADEEAVAAAAERIAQMEGVSSLTSYGQTLGKPLTASEVVEALDGMASGEGEEQPGALDASTVDMVYYLFHSGEDVDSMSAAELLRVSRGASALVDPAWTMTLPQLLSYLEDELFPSATVGRMVDDASREQVAEMSAQLDEAAEKLSGPDYSRLILTMPYDSESEEAYALLDEVEAEVAAATEGYYLVGQPALARDISRSFLDEFNFISWITAVAIYLIVAVAFRSWLLPLPLVLAIQCAYSLATGLNGLFDNHIYYMAIIVVQAILMGAAIDYAILFTSNYREARRELDVRGSIARAYATSVPTVLTSGAILVITTLALGLFGGGAVSQICMVLSEGSAMSMLLVLVLLPGVLAALDRFAAPRDALPDTAGHND